jgi:hypothetical protein
MRAFDIALLVICIQLSLTFVGEIGLFPGGVIYATPQHSGMDFMTGGMAETQNLVGSQTPNTVDYLFMTVSMITNSILLLGKMLVSVVIFVPELIFVFHVPIPLAVVLQALIYIMYAWAYAQFLAGRSGAMIQ